MLDKLKHGYDKIKDVIEDIAYNIPNGMWFIIKSSLICLFWIILVC